MYILLVEYLKSHQHTDKLHRGQKAMISLTWQGKQVLNLNAMGKGVQLLYNHFN